MATNFHARPETEEARLTAYRRKAIQSVKDWAGPEATADQVPLALDLITFVMWLRDSTDFFSGPDLDQHHPVYYEPDFSEVLAELALTYTGE